MQKIIIKPVLAIDNKAVEEIEKLRTNVISLKAQVLNITSVTGREGKLMVSFWLAKSLSEIGKKVILINADMRKNDIDTIININITDGKGLSDYLMGRVSIEGLIYEINFKNLNAILPGQTPQNPAELLYSPKFKNLIDYCRNNYEYVIIDAPAAGEVADAAVIASYTDGSILIVKPGMADCELAREVKEQLEKSGSKLLGAVINKV